MLWWEDGSIRGLIAEAKLTWSLSRCILVLSKIAKLKVGRQLAQLVDRASHVQRPISRCSSLRSESQPGVRCCVSPPHSVFCYYPASPMWPPSSLTSSGFLLQPKSNSRRWCWPSMPSTELHLSTSKHWSDHKTQHEHFTLLHQLVGWYHRWKQTKPAKSQLFSLCSGASVVEQTLNPKWQQKQWQTCMIKVYCNVVIMLYVHL